MAGNNTSYTIATGDNYGGLTAGQVNFTDGKYWDEGFQTGVDLSVRS